MPDEMNNGYSREANSPDDSPFVMDRGYSLESILAEIKGSAFIDGDTRTPSGILEAEAERILREASGQSDSELDLDLAPPQGPEEFFPAAPKSEPEDFFPASPTQEPFEVPQFDLPQPAPIQPTSSETPEDAADRLLSEAYDRYDVPELFSPDMEPEFSETNEIPMIVTPEEDDAPAEKGFAMGGAFFGATLQEKEPRAFDINLDDDTGSGIGEITTAGASRDAIEASEESIQLSAERSILFDQATISDDELGMPYDEADDYSSIEDSYEEPRLKDQAKKFARTCNSISQRLLPATLITIIMILITIVYESGMVVPYGIGHSLEYAACTLIILLLIVMMLCIEILVRGVEFLISGSPNAETLILFSCVFSLISATFTVLSGSALMLPFCAVSAMSLIFAAFGERSNLRAMTESLKIAISSAEPYGIQAEYNENLDNSVLKKTYSRTDGFYANLVQQDISEFLYSYATPILLISALLITVINVLMNGVVENSLHILSALLAAAAPLSALLSYSLPFGIVTKALKGAGVALAGWGGADDIAHTDGVCVTDDDLFPQGTLGLTAIKVFDGAVPNNVLCYTASLIIASGSGLAPLFAEAIQEKGITPRRVANFDCHESGISALVQGHQVSTGSAAYMNLIGVRVPDDSNMRNAIFTAVNNRLVAMFTIDYKPLPAVQRALISLIKWRIDLFFAMRDFNITPSMVGQKFKVPFESFVFMPVKESYSISDPYSGKQGRMASILVRESLGPFAEAITAARLLRSATTFASIISVASAGLGVFLMFLMLWDGSFLSATPGNLILYMLCMLAATLIVCGYVRIRR